MKQQAPAAPYPPGDGLDLRRSAGKSMNLLKDLSLFVSVAKFTSFAQAARSHRLSPSQVTARIFDLEQELGAQLFYRNSRSVKLTLEGEIAFQRALGILTHANNCIHPGGTTSSLEGYVTIEASSAISRALLSPILAAIRTSHPGLRTELNHPELGAIPMSDRCDISLGQRPPIGQTRYACLGSFHSITAASPKYLDARGTPELPNHLRDHPCLPYIDRYTGAVIPWKFHNSGRIHTFSPAGNVLLDDADGQIFSAELGFGIVQTADFIVTEQIKSGSLVPILANWNAAGAPFFAVLSTPGASDPCAVAIFEAITRRYPSDRPLIEGANLRRRQIAETFP